MTDATNQFIGDMMILQVLADSEHVNDQEREVLRRWMDAAPAPAMLDEQDAPRGAQA